jgi:hypothetical protein
VCLRYADLEKRLGEVDRARMIYRHCSNFCDPRSMPSFWQIWHNFEVNFGNEVCGAMQLQDYKWGLCECSRPFPTSS